MADMLFTHGMNKESAACVRLIISNARDPSEKDNEICVRVFRDRGTRQYSLNGRNVSITSMRQFLMKVGLGMQSTSPPFIILQNTVTMLPTKNGKELASIICDASGGKLFSLNVERALGELKRWNATELVIRRNISGMDESISKDLQQLGIANRIQGSFCQNSYMGLLWFADSVFRDRPSSASHTEPDQDI